MQDRWREYVRNPRREYVQNVWRTYVRNPLENVRQPAYTGENRCTPCTVLNLLLAAAGSGAVALVSPAAAVVAFAVSLLVIYLRGYLVPRTPTITTRYFPAWVLELFDKEPVSAEGDGLLDGVPPEVIESAVEYSSAGPRLDPTFRRAWNDRIAEARASENDRFAEAPTSALDRDEVADLFGVEAEAVSAMAGNRYLVDGERLVQWPSGAALLADVTAGRALRTRCPGWDDLTVEDRVEALTALRGLRHECPACGASLSRTEETVDSCCQPPVDVVSVSCEECGAHVAETRTGRASGTGE